MKKQVTLEVEGMTCSGCAGNVKTYLEKQGGQEVQVDLAGGEAMFEIDEDKSLDQLTQGLKGIGYPSHLPSADETKKTDPLLIKLFVSWALFLPLMLSMFLPWEVLHNPWFQMALALPVYLIGAEHFGKSAWGAVKNGTSNMDVLIFIGATASFGYSLYGTIAGLGMDYLFFESAAGIISMVLLGNYLEKKALERTNKSVKKLTSLRPKTANLVSLDAEKGETVETINSSKLSPGQIIVVNSGEQIPCDGKVMSGEAYADASLLTGESQPIILRQGAQAKAGYVVDGASIYVQVERTGQKDTIGQINELVKKARSKKPPIQRFSDRVSAVFVPLAVGFAILWFFVAWLGLQLEPSDAFLRSIAILVIACPCAMGIAVPAAVTVGLGKASKMGLIFKSAAVVEQLSKLHYILFDKTGTLTYGKPTIAAKTFFKYSQEEVAPYLKAVFSRSNHPLSKAIKQDNEAAKHLAMKEVKEVKGKGLKAETKEGQKLIAGNPKWLKEEAIELHGPEAEVLVARDGELIAGYKFQDSLKIGMEYALKELHRQGMQTAVISGDLPSKAEQIAMYLGIKESKGSLLPEDKLDIIESYKQRGVTAMVGDGINDAPALATADIGISLGGATDMAQLQAEVIIMGNQAEGLSKMVPLSKTIYKTIRQNLFWAFFYNVLAIPIAAAGLLNPIWAAAVMALSDVIVIGNSLLLERKIK